MGLWGDVRLNDFIGDVAATAAKVASCPDMTPPQALAQVGKFPQQTIGACAFHPLDEPTDGHVRRDGEQHMDRSRRDMPLEDIDTRLLTFFADNGTDPFRHFTTQNLVAIRRDPDDMEMDRERCMGAMAIVTHARESSENLLKLPPKGGGFAPPNWRQ